MEVEKKQLLVLFIFIGIISIGCIVGTSLAAIRYNYVFNKNGNVTLIDEDGVEIVIDRYFKNTANSRKTIHEISSNIGRYQFFNGGIKDKEDARFKLLITKFPYKMGLSLNQNDLNIFTTGDMGLINNDEMEKDKTICDSIEFGNNDSFFINSSKSDNDEVFIKVHQYDKIE